MIAWAVAALLAGPGCGVADRVPVCAPPCFGAAARDPLHPCHNSPRGVVPKADDALLLPNSPCRPFDHHGAFNPCEFGVRGRPTFALIGDSHAATWRAALDVVAQAERVRGVSITRPGCPFSAQIPASPDLGPAQCRRLQEATLRYLRTRRVRTIFVADWAQPASGPHGGTAGYGGGPAAFGAMLDRVPRTVRRIYVLRDNPGASLSTASCVARHRTRCSLPRARVLVPDPAVAAARGRPRVRVIDLARVFCDARSCHPVIGGAYVYKDDNHMNRVFASTLGPLLLRRVRLP
jgi:hypothetical protein